MITMAPGANHVYGVEGGVEYYRYQYFHNSPHHNHYVPVLGIDVNDRHHVIRHYGYESRIMWAPNQTGHHILISNWPLNLVEIAGTLCGVDEHRRLIVIDDSSGTYGHITCELTDEMMERLTGYGCFVRCKGRVAVLNTTRQHTVVRADKMTIVQSPALGHQIEFWKQALAFRKQLLRVPWRYTPVAGSKGCLFDGGNTQPERPPTNLIEDSIVVCSAKPIVPSPPITTDCQVMGIICDELYGRRFESISLGALVAIHRVEVAVRQLAFVKHQSQSLRHPVQITNQGQFKQLCRSLINIGVVTRFNKQNSSWLDPIPLRGVYAILLFQLRRTHSISCDSLKQEVSLDVPPALLNELVSHVIKRNHLGNWHFQNGIWFTRPAG